MPISEIPIDATEPTILIPEVRRLNLGPGDILVLRFLEHLSPETCNRLREEVKRICHPEQRVLILEDGTEIDVIHDAQEARTTEG